MPAGPPPAAPAAATSISRSVAPSATSASSNQTRPTSTLQHADGPDLIARTIAKSKPQPLRKNKRHYALKWSKKSTKSCWEALKTSFRVGKGATLFKKGNQAPNKLSISHSLIQAEALLNLGTAVIELFNTYKKADKTHQKKSDLFDEATRLKDLAKDPNQKDPELAARYAAQAAILMQMRGRIHLMDSIVQGVKHLSVVGGGISSSVATVGAVSGIMATATVTAIATASAGVALLVPAALFFGYGTYKMAMYSSKHSKANYWECALHLLEKGKSNPEVLKDNDTYKRLKASMLKKDLLKDGDPKEYEKMRAHAFDQCLQRKKSFAINYLKQALIAEHNNKPTQMEAGSVHNLLKKLNVSSLAMAQLETSILPIDSLYLQEQLKETLDKLIEKRLIDKSSAPTAEEVKAVREIMEMQDQKTAMLARMRDEALEKFISLHLGF